MRRDPRRRRPLRRGAYRRYLQWLLPQGPVALAINADTGEGPHLWPDERERVLRVAVEEAGDIPVIAGLSAQFTEQAVEEAKRAEGAGARGLLVFPIPVYQGTPLDPAIPVAYHEAIARGCGLPMVAFQLQPALGGVIFSEETLRRIAAIDSVVALKEASFDARLYLLTRRMIESLPRPIDLLTGDDNFIYESFVLGAEGALIGFGTLATELQVEMYGLTARDAGRRHGRSGSGSCRSRRSSTGRRCATTAPGRRSRCSELGVIESTVMRPPLLRSARPDEIAVRDALEAAGLLPARVA